jgi:hypothetical protein
MNMSAIAVRNRSSVGLLMRPCSDGRSLRSSKGALWGDGRRDEQGRGLGTYSMSERVRESEEHSAPPVPATLKHCWVTDRHGRLPTLLLEWRQTASGYQGRVPRPVQEENGWVLVEEWLPASFLGPA